jgi:hypothetical protein
MHLSEKEIEHLERLKKSQGYIYKMRYVFLFFGVLLIILSFGSFFYFFSLPDKSLYEKFANHPMFYLLLGVGGVAIGYAYQGWRGNSVYTLLIKVIEELNSIPDRDDST